SFKTYVRSLPTWDTEFTTDDAYRKATNCLAALEIDVKALESKYSPVSERQQIDPGAWHRKERYAPVFWVRWGKAVTVELGAKGELLYLMEDSDLYSQQKIAFKDEITNLQIISDEAFTNYPPLERTNLVLRYCAVRYQSWTNRIATKEE